MLPSTPPIFGHEGMLVVTLPSPRPDTPIAVATADLRKGSDV